MSEADAVLIEAMREVDAMLPGTTPIAPPESVAVFMRDLDALACHGIRYDRAAREFVLRDGRRVPNTVTSYDGWQRLFALNDAKPNKETL